MDRPCASISDARTYAGRRSSRSSFRSEGAANRIEPASWSTDWHNFPPLAASCHGHIATAGQGVGKVTVQRAAACSRFPRDAALKRAFLILVGNVAMWRGDLREFPLLAADFRFNATSSLFGRV